MVVFSLLEKKGNLGNQLFQIASTIGLAKKYNSEFAFPTWKYADYFENELPKIPNDKFEIITEKYFHFHEWKINSNKNVDLNGWMQSEKYFDKSITKHYFQFKSDFVTNLKEKYKILFAKKTILISIRRGDFVGHKDYFQLPILYYILALNQEFPNWRNSNLLFTSDDISYCKIHFSFLENAFFAENLNVIEQLCLGSLCNDFIISNSTFSWWIAFLGEKNSSKIVRPLHYFDNQKAIDCADKDYFPERWTIFNHLDKKLDLTKVTCIIKNENLKLINLNNKKLSIELLNHNFQTTIISDFELNSGFRIADYQYFSKNQLFKNEITTKNFIKKSIQNSKTDSLVVLNADLMLVPFFIYEEIQSFFKEQKDSIKLEISSVTIARKPFFEKITRFLDIGILYNIKRNESSSATFLIFDKMKSDSIKKQNSELKMIKSECSFSFSHQPILYFGINEKFFWIKFKLYSFKKMIMNIKSVKSYR